MNGESSAGNCDSESDCALRGPPERHRTTMAACAARAVAA